MAAADNRGSCKVKQKIYIILLFYYKSFVADIIAMDEVIELARFCTTESKINNVVNSTI